MALALPSKVIADHAFGFGQLGVHQFKRHQRRAFGAGCGGLAALGGGQRAGWLSPAARRMRPTVVQAAPAVAGIAQVVGQRLFNHGAGQFFVRHAGIDARHRRQDSGPFHVRRKLDFGLQGSAVSAIRLSATRICST
jgi:hypothetical protein